MSRNRESWRGERKKESKREGEGKKEKEKTEERRRRRREGRQEKPVKLICKLGVRLSARDERCGD